MPAFSSWPTCSTATAEEEESPPPAPLVVTRATRSITMPADLGEAVRLAQRASTFADQLRERSIATFEYEPRAALHHTKTPKRIANYHHERLELIVGDPDDGDSEAGQAGEDEGAESEIPSPAQPLPSEQRPQVACLGCVNLRCVAKGMLALVTLVAAVWLWKSGWLAWLLSNGEALAQWMRAHPWSLGAFFVANALLEATLVISSVSKVVQPFVPVSFGFVVGPLVLIAANLIASVCCFVSGRFVVRSLVLQHAGHLRLFRAVDRALAGDPSLMYVLRLSPLNDAVVSYLLAVTHVSFGQYVRGAALEAAKRTAEMTYVGYLLSLGLARQDATSQPGAVAIAVGGLLAIVVGSVLVERRVKSELAVLSTHAHDGLSSPTRRLRHSVTKLRVLRRLVPPSGSASAGAQADADAETDAPWRSPLTMQGKHVDAGMGHLANR